jgi:hypothetical protein
MTMDEKMGFIGVNTSTPLYPLDINGSTNITGCLYSSTHSNAGNLIIGSNLILSQTNLYANNHNLGVNNTTPIFPLDVNGSIRTNSNIYLGSTVYLPPANMTSNVLINNGVTYTASASSWNGTFPWAAFQSADYSGWISGSGLYNSSGAYTGIVSSTFSGSNFNGEWLQFQSSSNMPLDSYFMQTDGNGAFTGGMPTSWVLGGSVDSSNWNLIDSQTNFSWSQYYQNSCNTYILDNVFNYNYLRLVCLSNNGSKNFVCIGLFYPITCVSSSNNTLMSGRIFSSSLSNTNDVYIGGNAIINGTLSNSSLVNTSNVAYNTSNVAYNTSNVAYTTSNVAYTTSNVAYTTSNIAYNTSNVAYTTSNVAYNTSNVAYSLSNGIVLKNNPGYCVIPGGILMQFGTVQYTQSSTSVSGTITFPLSFSATPYSITGTLFDVDWGYGSFAQTGEASTALMINNYLSNNCAWTAKSQSTYSTPNNFSWIAVGPK